MRKLEGKVAIVTGAAMGNGAEIAKVLAKYGAIVILTDILEQVHQTANKVKQVTSSSAASYIMDVACENEVNDVVKQVISKFGKVDILVNNAGIAKVRPFTELTNADIEKMINVNIKGVIYCTKAVIENMVQNRYGKIINISSVTGTLVADAYFSIYAATKGAVMGLTKALASEYGEYGINVNAILPGSIRTPMLENGSSAGKLHLIEKGIALKRLGTPEEIGEVTAFLASDESRYITGSPIIVDGGSTLVEHAGLLSEN